MSIRNSIVLLIFLLKITYLHSQTQFADETQLKSFLGTTTYVVLEDTPFSVFNSVVEEKMKKLWSITPYKVVKADEFIIMSKNPKNSFIYISLAQLTQNGKADNTNIYNILNLVLGDKSGNINKMPDLGSVPLSFEEDEEEAYGYKIGGILMAMQYYVNDKIKHPNDKIEDLAKKNIGEIKKKELWLLASDLGEELNTLEKIKKIYPFPVKLVSEDEIEKAIDQKRPNVAFLHKIAPVELKKNGTSQCWNFIISTEEGKPLYFDQHKIENIHSSGLLIEDFKNFAK